MQHQGGREWRVLPRKSLLEDPPPCEIDLDHDILAQNAMTLLEKLHDFKVDGSIRDSACLDFK